MLTMHVGGGRTVGGLTVFPLWTDGGDPGEDYLPFAAVEENGWGGVGELDSPVVSLVQAVNNAMLPALLLEGEAVQGGQQDRVVVTSTMVPAGGGCEVPVACVEAQRWHGSEGHRMAGRVPPQLRSDVVAGLRPDGRSTDQRVVWQRVASYRAAEQRSAGGSLLEPTAAIGGVVRTVELFDRHETLASAWPGILRAATVDARSAAQVPTSGSSARRAVRRLGRAMAELSPTEGHSTPVRTDGMTGTTLWWNGRAVHLAVHAA